MAVIWTEFIKRSTKYIVRLMLAFVMTHNMCFVERKKGRKRTWLALFDGVLYIHNP